ncbi:hypothetical protein [Streptacidiphilus rugosus]|uniref:hypothetical protein n=1 Tax=Streptacidiphilus rugosus TaxID=405783 RepID=UPI00055F385F|nr:hypothetical protein [Streptacidiphilus rugosus]
MARGNWQAGLSRVAIAVIVLQGIVLVLLLGLTWALLNGDGWFDSRHDRALLWDDAAVVTGLVCLAPLLGFALLRRSSGVFAGFTTLIVSGLVLLAVRPA